MRHLFGGVVNVHDPGKLGGDEVLSEMTCADNTEISTRFGGRRRLGRTQRVSGAAHSGFNTLDGKQAFLVHGGFLKKLNADKSVTSLRALVSDDRMGYTEVNHVVMFSNGVDIGVIEGGACYDMATTTERFKRPTPAAHHLTFLNGCVYGALGAVITCTDPYNLDVVDKRLSKIPVPGRIGMLQAVKGGLWVSTDKEIVFLRGGGLEDFVYERKADYAAVPYASKIVFAKQVGLDSDAPVVVFGAERGVCIGTPDGQLINLSQEKVNYTTKTSGSILVKERDGQVSIVLSLAA